VSSAVSRAIEYGWSQHLGAPVDPVRLRTELAAGTLVDAARSAAARHPDDEAIRVGAEAITHSSLDHRTRRVASILADQGVDVGSRVVVVGANSLEFVIAYLAALRAGAAVTTVSDSLQSAELDGLIAVARPQVLIVDAACQHKLDTIGWAATRMVMNQRGPGTLAAATDAGTARDGPALGPSAVAHLAFTSGTTGMPKVVPLTHANVLSSVRAVMLAWRWSPNDVLVHALPLQHAHGLTAVHLSIVAGSRSVILPTFDPRSWCAAISEHRATVLFAVPTMYERLLASDCINGTDTSSLRLVTSGSAPLSPTTSDAVLARFGQRPLERYGLTEAGFVLSNRYEGERLAGSVGYPLPGVEVDVVGHDGQPVPDGADGEIVVRGPQVFGGYGLDGDDTTSFFADGWLRTGDIGNRSLETGAISITGRLKELIISGGMNVFPREIELALESQDGVVEAAVVGVPSARWGEEVCAFVVTDGSVDTSAVAEAVRVLLAPHKRPKRYTIVDTLPRNALGKLVRSRLPEWPSE
jgi:malonyl-CoA/methylmalonyl-CoA synthetase